MNDRMTLESIQKCKTRGAATYENHRLLYQIYGQSICESPNICADFLWPCLSLLSMKNVHKPRATFGTIFLSTDYGRLVRISPSPHGRKSTPTPKFLATAEAYFVCHIGPNFQISLIYAFNGCSVGLKAQSWKESCNLIIKTQPKIQFLSGL